MAYATTNPPVLTHTQPIAGPGKVWAYYSTHTRAVAVSSTFGFSNAGNLGIKKGDLFIVSETTAADANNSSDGGITSLHRVIEAGSTYTILSAGLLISSAS